jgi:hypothetical protein
MPPAPAAGDPGCGSDAPPAGAAIWLKASQGVKLEGEGVVEWANLGGSGANALQPDAAKRPALAPNAVNGKPVVRFDGQNDRLLIKHPIVKKTALTLAFVTATRKFQVGVSGTTELGNSGTSNCILMWPETVRMSNVHVCAGQKHVSFRFGVGQEYTDWKFKYARPTALGPTDFTITMATLDGPMRRLHIDGQLIKEVTAPGTGAVSPVEDTAYMGRSLFPANGDPHWPGDVAEAFVYDVALPEPERAKLERYLRCEYGLAAR